MKPQRQGFFLVLEGIDGAGKSSLIQPLADAGRQLGMEVCTTREPGGTPMAEQIRALLLNPAILACSVETELLLLFAARAQHLQQRIRPAVAEGKLVISERFSASSYAYQGSGLGADAGLIAMLEQHVLQNFQPHLVIILDLPVEQARQRLNCRGGAPDRYQRRPAGFAEAVRQGYLQLARENGGRGGQQYRVVDASRDKALVSAELCSILKEVL